MNILGINVGDIWPILIIVAWLALSRWVLPRLGVRTWMSAACEVGDPPAPPVAEIADKPQE